jgi:hypothetical protein
MLVFIVFVQGVIYFEVVSRESSVEYRPNSEAVQSCMRMGIGS